SFEKLKEQVDIMASYKYNVFHWHLNDDPGWRLESKKYPQLQANDTFTRMPGKFYTQAQFKEMVEYCLQRNMILIPELDTPGHSLAFRKAFKCTMKDPIAKERVIELINELCSLAPASKMPYIHLGTDEVRAADEYVNADYLPALNKAVRGNGREVIGWWHGLHEKGDDKQIQQTWAKNTPRKGNRHIDSRSNYVNHMDVFDTPLRTLFQQPCRVPYGDDINLGGILCYWPDMKVDDENVSFTNSPIYTSLVAYAEAIWCGVPEDKPEYWSQMPPANSKEFQKFKEFEQRLIGQRRFLKDVPFLYVRQTNVPWKLIGPFKSGQIANAETPDKTIKTNYEVSGKKYSWWPNTTIGGTVHVRHFFGFPAIGSDQKFEQGDDVVYALTYVNSPVEQEVGCWINFNTISTSDPRAGTPAKGRWGSNQMCDVWVNDARVEPPNWIQPGKAGKEHALVDEIFTSRKPTKIKLKKGWNKVLLRTAPRWKWSFTFMPVEVNGNEVREVKGLRFATEPK
ncbi:MAG: family 20 glycosylhydrolase, partial [Lentisphaeria bacterium]